VALSVALAEGAASLPMVPDWPARWPDLSARIHN